MKGVIKGKGSDITYWIDGKQVTKAQFDLLLPDKPLVDHGLTGELLSHLPGCWPMYSEALAVHPKQIQEAQDNSRVKGVPTEFLPDGRAVLRDRRHRKAYLRAYGFHDKGGGYGD